jgi:hypothetical protein
MVTSFINTTETDYNKYMNTITSFQNSHRSKMLDTSIPLIHKMRNVNRNLIIDPLTMDSFNRSDENYTTNIEFFKESVINRIKIKYPGFSNLKKKVSKKPNNYYANTIKMKIVKKIQRNTIE